MMRYINHLFARFTTPDLLWAAFPSHTPYQYAYNSPLIWSDPSGLAPEKERDREKLLNLEIEEERAECGYEILDRKQNEIKNSSKNQTSNSGSRDGNEGSAPGDLSAGTGRGISNLLSEYTDNTQTAMFSTLLAQHLDVGPTGGPMISPGGGFGGGIDTDYGSNLFGIPDQIGIPWIEVARGELGVKEIKGEIHNSRIIEYHSTTLLNSKSDEVAWCSSFLNWCLLQAGIIGTNSAGSQSWINWKDKTKLEMPIFGAIAVFKDEGDNQKGHCAFVVGITPKGEIVYLGGNQSDQVSYQIGNWKGKYLKGYFYPKGSYLWLNNLPVFLPNSVNGQSTR